MSEKKYLVRTASTTQDLDNAINEVADEYYLAHLIEKQDILVAVLSQRSEGKYDDITSFKKAPILEQEQTVPDGWEIIHHTSKEMILVKRNERKDKGVQE